MKPKKSEVTRYKKLLIICAINKRVEEAITNEASKLSKGMEIPLDKILEIYYRKNKIK